MGTWSNPHFSVTMRQKKTWPVKFDTNQNPKNSNLSRMIQNALIFPQKVLQWSCPHILWHYTQFTTGCVLSSCVDSIVYFVDMKCNSSLFFIVNSVFFPLSCGSACLLACREKATCLYVLVEKHDWPIVLLVQPWEHRGLALHAPSLPPHSILCYLGRCCLLVCPSYKINIGSIK